MIEAYIEKEITEIKYVRRKIFGKKLIEKKIRYGFLIDMYCWLHMSEMENIALNDFGKWDDITFIINVCYYGAISACKDRGTKITFNKDNIAYFLNKLPYPDFKEIGETIFKSRFMGKSMEEWARANQSVEDTKKKSGRKISKTSPSGN